MAILQANLPIPEEYRRELGERGQAIYEKLKIYCSVAGSCPVQLRV